MFTGFVNLLTFLTHVNVKVNQLALDQLNGISERFSRNF